MNLSKYFPLIIHGILACLVIGIALGVTKDGHYSMPVQGGLVGLGFGLGITAFIRYMEGN